MPASKAQSTPPPALAPLTAGLGLRWRPGRAPGQPGELNGVLGGYRVLVRLNRRAASVETRFRVGGLRLDTRAARGTVPDAFATGDRKFDRHFALCAGPPGVRAALSANTPEAAAFRKAAAAFPTSMGRTIARVEWDAIHLTAHLRRVPLAARLFRRTASGRATGGIDPVRVAALLPDMVSLADALETALRAHAQGTAESPSRR